MNTPCSTLPVTAPVARATPLANSSPSITTDTVPSVASRSRRPVPECSIISARQCSMPNRREESEKYTVPSVATAALLQNSIARPSTS